MLVPHYAFSVSAILKRKPLAATARRAGWIGCNIQLENIPPAARIPVIIEGAFLEKSMVRDSYSRLKSLQTLSTTQRGWTLDVLRLIQVREWTGFSTKQAYSLESELRTLYPTNSHIKEKIRQQLQVLRNQGVLEHVQRGVWRLATHFQAGYAPVAT
ncbi:MAG: dam-replacing family protein [Verrucomicrobia bacterium]|nr:dam-replacing family protein [Verrucomicrobiota bacterium]